MLVDFESIESLLRDPQDGTPLRRQVGSDSTEFSSDSGNQFGCVGGIPILVDFDNSVLSEAHIEQSGLASPVERNDYAGVAGFAKNLVSREIKATGENVDILLSKLAENPSALILVVGGGAVGNGMAELYTNPDINLISFDIYPSNNVQFVADAHNIPLDAESVDYVIIQAVLEHVLQPDRVVKEIHRVLKSGGVVYAETPFMQQVHEAAYDFTRYTESGHRYLFRHFELIRSGVAGGVGTALMWSIEHFFRGLSRSKKLGKLAKICFFWLQYFDPLVGKPYAVDAASGVYFMGVKSDTEVSPSQMITHYQGVR